MPLLKGKENIGNNIREMRKAGHPLRQSIAAAYHAAGVDEYEPAHDAMLKDMSPRDWAGVMRFVAEEMKEPEHAQDETGEELTAEQRERNFEDRLTWGEGDIEILPPDSE